MKSCWMGFWGVGFLMSALVGCRGDQLGEGEAPVSSTVQAWLSEVREASAGVTCSGKSSQARSSRLRELLSWLPVRRERARVKPSQDLVAYREVEEALACLTEGAEGEREESRVALLEEKNRITESLSHRLTTLYALYRKATEEKHDEAALAQIDQLCDLFQEHPGPLLEKLRQRQRALRLAVES